MAKVSNNPIPNLSTDWEKDPLNGLPYSGKSVQEFIRGRLQDASTDLAGKFGGVSYEGGRLIFMDEDGGKQLAAITLTGTSYIVSVETNRPTSFYVLNTEESTMIDLKPSTVSVEFGSTSREDFPEDYTFTLEVDSGNGYIDRTPASNTIKQGETGSVNVRNYLTNGANKVRIVVKGLTSEQPKTLVYTATLTSLNLTCNHSWNKAWIEGENYSINNIYFGGNLQKTLHVKIGDVEYTQQFAAATQYTSVAYEFDVTDKFPAGGTGVYDLSVWMEGGEVRTTPVNFQIMCVKADETTSAELVCINTLPAKAENYKTQKIFEYATYNLTSVVLDMNADIAGDIMPIVVGQTLTVQTQTKTAYTTNLQVDTEIQTDLSLVVKLSSGSLENTVRIALDNSNAFVATPGAVFYLNPAIRANNRADKYEIHNTAAGADRVVYNGVWNDFTMADDAWYADTDGNKALVTMAGSSLDIPDLKPLSGSATQSATIEFMYRASNIADYDTPVLSMMSTENYDQSNTRGIILFPTRLVVLSAQEKQYIYQKIDLPEDMIIHVAVVLQRNYGGIGRHLCRIFINGRENVTFEYTSTLFDANTPFNYVRMGQQSTDFYLYMMRNYTQALEGSAVMANYLNALIDTAETSKIGEKADNNILESGVIDYNLVKKAGFNCMVVETDDALPSLENPNTDNLRVNLHLEYNDTPEWNVTIYNIPMDGQGTTSMKYPKWNLRDKIKDSNTRWEYPNLRDDNGNVLVEKGKDGYIAGYGLHPKVSVITSKKNVASSSQGHKMGGTALYHELFEACEGLAMLPNDKCRVAVYQYPFIGFQKFSDGHYEFIGLYTTGPDKKDKKTFGYNATGDYPSLMMVEGPNHAPYMTRFLVPWNEDVFYDYPNETLSTGDATSKQEGWDADIAAGYSTDDAGDAQAIFNLFAAEFKPAYDAIYYTSPYLASLAESGKTLEQINANITTFQAGKTNGIKNELLTFYNSNYELIYFRYKTQRYEVLPKSVHDMKTFLGLSGSPTTAQLLEARARKYADVFNHVSKQESLFHTCFCEFFGVSDNDAKNTYWRKFLSLSHGGKWGFNQDDVDTLLPTDNNGQDTKEYWVEYGDTNNGAEIFQGSTSAFWTQLRNTCQTEIRDKMLLIVNKMIELAGKYKVSGATAQESVFNLIKYYFWDHSAKYFPAMAYNEDTLFTYINEWAKNPTASYNNVRPLTQVHGDHLTPEMAWVKRRIAYMFSKYRLGGFRAQDGDGYGTIEFTPAEPFDMEVKPAIKMYPRFSVGGAETGASERTDAGEVCVLHLPGSSDTTVYIKGADWLSDLGDLSKLKIASRGGSDEINFSVSGKRLRRVKVGDEDASAVEFNATSLSISGESIEEIDAQNASTVKGILELGNCARLKKAKLIGTALSQAMLPVGGRVKEVSLPTTTTTMFLHSLNLLEQGNITIASYANVERLYFNVCSRINPMAFLKNILDNPDNVLQFVTMLWEGTITETNIDNFEALAKLVANIYDPATGKGVGALGYENGQLVDLNKAPDIQGTIRLMFSAYQDSIDTIMSKIPTVKIVTDFPFYIRFQDPEVLRVLLEHNSDYGFDKIGITREQALKVTSFNQIFRDNTLIETFDEMVEFENVKLVTSNGWSYDFMNCVNLKSVRLPKNLQIIGEYCFRNTALVEITLNDNLESIRYRAFDSCKKLERVKVPNVPPLLSGHAFDGSDNAKFYCSSETVRQTYLYASEWSSYGASRFVVE